MNYEDIKLQFDAVIAHSQGIPCPQTDDLFEKWAKNKERFIRDFGGLRKCLGEVSIQLDDQARAKRIVALLDEIDNVCGNWRLMDFIQQNAGNFYTNITVEDFEIRDMWSDKVEKIIPAGMKIIKAFKMFETGDNLTYLQDYASRIIQEDKICGKLYMSVHPLDYLSASMNNHNWRSCHALDGEYRAGNLSYMADKTTIITYITTDKDEVLPLFPPAVVWNSKKWRMWLYVSEDYDIAFAGKQYPFASDEILNVIKKSDFFEYGHDWSHWLNHYIDEEVICINGKYLPIRGKLYDLEEVVKDKSASDDTTLHFNDVLRSCTYIYPNYLVKRNYGWARHMFDDPRVTVGEVVMCLHCGRHPITDPETMRCNACELEYGHEENDTYGRCDNCGSRMLNDDAIQLENGDYVCEDCYDRYCFTCSRCGQIYYNKDKHYDEVLDRVICNMCKVELEEEENGN